MTLGDQEKKLYSRVGIILGGILLIGLLWLGISRISIYYTNRNEAKVNAIIEKYEAKVDSLNKANTYYMNNIKILENKIDSMGNVKVQIINHYDKKINAIYNAGAVDHVMWLDSVITKVGGIQR
jgi:hypothetical protein